MNASEPYPLEKFSLTYGERKLFRMVSMATEFAFEVSIDQHKLKVVATDGSPVRPFTVSHL